MRSKDEDENGDEYWSNPQRGHDPNEILDLMPLRCDVKTNTIDSDETLMEINITGSADLQKASDCGLPKLLEKARS